MTLSRRRTLALVAGGLGLAALAALAARLPPQRALDYDPLPGVAPFRALRSGGGVSAASLALAGIDPPQAGNGDAALTARVAAVRDDLCGALFGTNPSVPGHNAMAYFTDVNCPNCRVLEHGLASVMARDSSLRLVRHELPLLGPASVTAARAILAAGLQDKGEALTGRLARAGLVTDEGYLRAVAAGLGIDADRLIADMRSPAIEAHLLTARALAQVFGLAGVPALVIGQTLVTGAVSGHTITEVVRDRRALPGPACPIG